MMLTREFSRIPKLFEVGRNFRHLVLEVCHFAGGLTSYFVVVGIASLTVVKLLFQVAFVFVDTIIHSFRLSLIIGKQYGIHLTETILSQNDLGVKTRGAFFRFLMF